jgi:mono/diheme cytochrome c family protein
MSLRRAAAATLAVIAATALGACGNQGGEGGQGSQDQQQATSGDAIFKQNCAGCHTLAAAGSQGQTGPNLDDAKPSAAAAERQVRNGGGGMPAFGDQLSDQQIKAVAEYVASSAGRGGR